MYVTERKVKFIATNEDACIRIGGVKSPGSGANIAAVVAATGLKRSTPGHEDEPGTYDVVGKPNPFAIEMLMA